MKLISHNLHQNSYFPTAATKRAKEFLFHCHRGAMKRNVRRQVACALHNFRTITIFPNIWDAARQKRHPLSSSSSLTGGIDLIQCHPNKKGIIVLLLSQGIIFPNAPSGPKIIFSFAFLFFSSILMQ